MRERQQKKKKKDDSHIKKKEKALSPYTINTNIFLYFFVYIDKKNIRKCLCLLCMEKETK